MYEADRVRMLTCVKSAPFAGFVRTAQGNWTSGEVTSIQEGGKRGYRFLTDTPLELSDLGRPIFDESGFVVDFVWDVPTR